MLDLYIICLGILLGSFLYTTALRLEKRESLLYRSQCDSCESSIDIIGLIPILGYILRMGKCNKCGSKINISYPLIEIVNGVLILLIYSKTGLSLDFIHKLVFFEILFLIGIIDFRTHLIFPHPIFLGLIANLIWILFINPTTMMDSVIGLLVGAGVFHWVSYIYQSLRKRVGLGEGDATLLGLIGFVLGWNVLFSIVFWAAFIGVVMGALLLLYRKRSFSSEIAFGPWLVISAFLGWMYPEWFQWIPSFSLF